MFPEFMMVPALLMVPESTVTVSPKGIVTIIPFGMVIVSVGPGTMPPHVAGSFQSPL